MRKQSYRLQGGNSYSLRDLFDGKNDKIVIPDLQRDYCWGNSEHDLVGPFVDSLLALDKSQDLTMGLIYGYYNPLMPDRLQLCDGQQRITTLFLILGILNRRLNNKYKDLLISKYELHDDDCEPYLQYAIRESSLYFISDLVLHYFIQIEDCDHDLKNAGEISNSFWFLQSYNSDPTILCILQAISTIETKLDSLTEEQLSGLGDFISGKNESVPHIEFLYYDMGNRTNGEETFVVINTTGEPLSANQNLKPLIINEYKAVVDKIEDKWEEMETWFWQHRDKSSKIPHTSDEGMSEFFRCVRLYMSKDIPGYLSSVDPKDKFPYRDIEFGKVYDLFKHYQRIYSLDYSERYDENCNYNNTNNKGRYTAKQLYALLPTIAYCDRFPKCSDENIKKIFHLFSIMAGYRSVDNIHQAGGQTAPAWNAMKLIDEIAGEGDLNGDVLSLKDYTNNYFEHERAKINLIYASHDRKAAEKIIVEAEQNKIFNGRLKVIVDWSNNNIDVFASYMEKIRTLWKGNCDNNIDILRRSLLTQQWNEYPILVEGKSHRTLGWQWSDWYRFFIQNSSKIKEYLGESLSPAERILNYTDTSNPCYAIIKDEAYLKESSAKNLYDCRNGIIVLMQKERASADYCLFFNNIPYPKNLLGKKWRQIWVWENLLFCDHDSYDLTIDYEYHLGNGYKIFLFSGKHKNLKPFNCIEKAESWGFYKTDDRHNGWCSDYIADGKEAKDLMIKIAHWVD
ncbi:MAG: DUF262 domain-containing protein [Bacteroidales bacterium]